MANNHPEKVDPIYEYVDREVEELRKELISMQRSIAILHVHFVSNLILAILQRYNRDRYETLNKPIKSQRDIALKKIKKSDKPLDVAYQFTSTLVVI
jgi:hypothetical protein